MQDGSNEPAVVFPDSEDGEIQNFNTNFKFVSLADFESVFPNLPAYDPNAFDPRNPKAITELEPVVVSESMRNPQSAITEEDTEATPLFGTLEADTLDIAGTKNFVQAREGNDTVNITGSENRIYGDGDDALFFGTDDYVIGGEGSDQFWVADPDLPTTANRIADFELDNDVIGCNNLGCRFANLTLTQQKDNTLTAVADTNVAVLQGIDANSFNASNFALT